MSGNLWLKQWHPLQHRRVGRANRSAGGSAVAQL